MTSLRHSRVLVLLAVLTPTALAQLTPDQQAQMLLAAGRRAYNEKNYPFAADRFREFLQRHGGHRDVPAARYGLALALLDGPARDADKAMEQLTQLLPLKEFADRPHALYYAGVARRAQGVKTTDVNAAKQRFDEAARHFGDGAEAFFARAKSEKAPAKGPPEALEWAVRCRCDQAEMLLRQRKAKEAREAVAGFMSEKAWTQSRYVALGLYYHGFACFLLDDVPAAGRSLNRDSVLGNEVFGTHARYLVGRLHHLNTKQDEREEARQAYQAVLRDHEANRKSAQQRLGQPADAETRDRLQRLASGPAPEHVGRAAFFLGVLQYEDGRFADAQEQFKAFVAQHPKAGLVPEARLRLGACQVQLKQPDEALRTLQPLADKEPALADQALCWMGRARLAKADANKPETYRPAIDLFRRAAEAAGKRGANAARGEALLDLADAQQQARQYRDAVATYATVLDGKLLPQREDEATLGLATAHQLDGNLAEADKACARFLERCKDSPLLPSLLFRHAENAALAAAGAEKLTDPAARARESARLNDEAAKRYAALIEKYPELSQANLARHSLGMAFYRKGDLEKAQKALGAVPAADRTGELAVVSYCLADIALRQVPERVDDAVAAGKAEERLKAAAELLESFVGAAGDSTYAPDALLKLGYCRQRVAKLLVQPADRQAALTAAKAAYEQMQQKYAKHPAYPQAIFERAKVMAALNDAGARNELRRFTTDPALKKAPIAPLAVLHLATVYRRLNRPADAVKWLTECRKQHEEALAADPVRAGWAALLQYHHAAALRELGRLDEARKLFEQAAAAPGDRAEVFDAALRAGQCLKDAAERKLTDGRKRVAGGQRGEAERLVADGAKELREAAAYLTKQEQALRGRKPDGEEAKQSLARARARLLYEAAWAWRALADTEVEAARRKLPKGAEVPRQPAEAQVRERYVELIKAFPELAVNADARFELAEVLSGRGEHDEAIKLLQGALEGEKEPSAELTDRIKLRLGSCLLERGARQVIDGTRKLTAAKPADKAAAEKLVEAGKKDVEAALEQLQPVSGNPKSPLVAQATYREAECLLQLGKTDEAVKLLTKFRDQPPLQNVPGLSDRALLRLGWALGEKKQWDQSRQAYEALLGRFGGGSWAQQARYGVGWAQQNLGQYDAAVNTYNQVTAAVATEVAARAQMNIGLCRMAQKRYAEASTALLVVPYTYDYPELSALALMEAARALSEDKQSAQAAKLLRRVLRDHAGTAHAEAAKKRLADLGES